MINYSLKTISELSDIGDLPDIFASWSTKFPLFNGKTLIGRYIVPNNKVFSLKSITISGDYAGIPRTNALGAYRLGSVYFQVDSVTKMEYAVDWAGGTFTASVGETTFGARWRNIVGMIGEMNFTSGQVIRLVVSPFASGGTVPQVLWCPVFVMKDIITGATIIEKGRSITILSTASQVILTYTIPANGVVLKSIQLQATSADFMLGMLRLMVNGSPILEIPVISNTYNTTPGQIRIPFTGGLPLNKGDSIESRCDIINSLEQRLQMILFGIETDVGGGSSEVSYVF